MTIPELQQAIEHSWDYNLHDNSEQDRFLYEISNPVEYAIADNNREVIDHLMNLYPIERYFFIVAIDHGYNRNPEALELYSKLEEDKKKGESILHF